MIPSGNKNCEHVSNPNKQSPKVKSVFQSPDHVSSK